MNLHDFSTMLATWCAVWLIASSLISGGYPRFASQFSMIQSAQRAWLLRLLVLTPVLLAMLSCVELFVVPGELVPFHCHLSNCAAHDPNTQPSFFFVKEFLLILFVPIVFLTAHVVWRTWSLQRQWRQWSKTTSAGYRYLDCAESVACVLGLVKPTIYFSRGFIASLPAQALNVVIAHERAHATRYDNFWIIAIRILSLGWMNQKYLLADLELAQEQACDQIAAAKIGDAVTVAETLVQCQRLTQTPDVSCAFFRGQLEARVKMLLDNRYTALSPLTLLRYTSLALMLMAALAIPLHYAIEII